MNTLLLHRRNPQGEDVGAQSSQLQAGELEGLTRISSRLGSHRDTGTEGTL